MEIVQGRQSSWRKGPIKAFAKAVPIFSGRSTRAQREREEGLSKIAISATTASARLSDSVRERREIKTLEKSVPVFLKRCIVGRILSIAS